MPKKDMVRRIDLSPLSGSPVQFTGNVTPGSSSGGIRSLKVDDLTLVTPDSGGVLGFVGGDGITTKQIDSQTVGIDVDPSVMRTSFSGQMVLSPGSILYADMIDTATTMYVTADMFSNGDLVLLQARGVSELIQIASSGTIESSGIVSYSVVRNISGSGAQTWNAGDAVLRLGGIGSHIISLHAEQQSVAGDSYGPSLVITERTGESTWAAVALFGNLRDEYGLGSSDVWGIAGGEYGVDGKSWFSVEPDGGMRIGSNTDILAQFDGVNGIRLYSDGTQRVWIKPDGSGWLGGDGKFNWDTSGNVTLAGDVVAGGGTIYIGSDGFWLGDPDSGSSLTLNEVKDVFGIGTGDFGLRIYDSEGVPHISLLSRANNVPYLRLGAQDADTWLQWDENGLVMKGSITATDGSITGSLYVGDSEPRILIDGVNKRIRSTNYFKNTAGFNIDGETGDVEIENLTARGTIKTAVFQRSLITAFAGSQVVAKSASVTAKDTILSGSTYPLHVKPQQEDAAPFVDGDLIHIKTEFISTYAIVNTGSRGGNLALNSTFNQDLDSDGIGDGWTVYNNSVGTEPHTATIVAYGGVDNGRYQRISWSVNNSSSKGIHGDVNFQPNTSYVISWWAKANLTAYCPMQTAWNNWPDVIALSSPTLTTSWQRYAFLVKTGATADFRIHLTIQYGFATTGSLDIDHVMVEATTELHDWKADDYYSYTATYHSGAAAGAIPVGTAVIDYGKNGDGRVFITADDDVAAGESPYLSISTHDMAKPPVWTERVRLGNLEGLVPGGEYGLWTDNGWFKGIVTASVIRSAESGARIEFNTERIFGTDGTDVQWYADATDGKLYAGGGKVSINRDGIMLAHDGNGRIVWREEPGWLSDEAASLSSNEYGTYFSSTSSRPIRLVCSSTMGYGSELRVGYNEILLGGSDMSVSRNIVFRGDLYKRTFIGGTETDFGFGVPIMLTTPATAPAWNDTAYSTVSTPQPLNVASTFGIPENTKAILVSIDVRDSAGAGNYSLALGPNNTYYYAAVCRSQSASVWSSIGPVMVPCMNGDVYYRILASGTNTLSVHIRIWGYLL